MVRSSFGNMYEGRISMRNERSLTAPTVKKNENSVNAPTHKTARVSVAWFTHLACRTCRRCAVRQKRDLFEPPENEMNCTGLTHGNRCAPLPYGSIPCSSFHPPFSCHGSVGPVCPHRMTARSVSEFRILLIQDKEPLGRHVRKSPL
jgi:hypothetical protein